MLVVPTDQADDKRDAQVVADENQAMQNMPKRNARKIKGGIKKNENYCKNYCIGTMDYISSIHIHFWLNANNVHRCIYLQHT